MKNKLTKEECFQDFKDSNLSLELQRDILLEALYQACAHLPWKGKFGYDINEEVDACREFSKLISVAVEKVY